MNRRRFLVLSGSAVALSACSQPAASPAKPAETKPAEAKPTEAAKPAAAAPTGAPAAAGKPAAKYPARTLTFTTHSNPGGGGDLLGRQLTEALKAQSITAVLENKPGGSGAINMGYVAGRPADGHTVMIVTLSNLITPHLAGTPQNYTTFKPVARLQLEDEAILVHRDSPHQTIEALVEASKKGGVKYAGSFIGNIDSFVAFSLANKAGFQIDYVPFEGGGEITTALLGKQVDVAVTNPAEAMPQLQSGEFKMIALSTAERSPNFRDVPTLKEKGYDIVMEQWRGTWVHKDTSDDLVTQLADILKKATQEPSFQKYTQEGLLRDAFLGPKEALAALEAQDKEISALVDQLGIRDTQKR
jgi:putative tricarboxylic transport membrane protein